MGETRKSSAIAVVIVLGMFLQVLFVMADSKDTPYRAAVEFTEAYFKVDPDMSKRVCKGILNSEKGNLVDQYIAQKKREAGQRGFGLFFERGSLSHVITHTVQKDEKTAKVVIEGTGKYSLRSFFTGEKFEIHDELSLVKEGDKWKVCGSPFELASAR